MQQDALTLARIMFQVAIEDDNSIPDIGGSMRGIARRIAKLRAIADFNRAAVKQRNDCDSLVSH